MEHPKKKKMLSPFYQKVKIEIVISVRSFYKPKETIIIDRGSHWGDSQKHKNLKHKFSHSEG